MPGINRERMSERVNNTLAMAADDQATSRFRGAIQSNRVAEVVNKLLHLDEENARQIHKDLIYPNPLNKPYMEEIEETAFQAMKLSILDVGLVHNLVVLEDGLGRYRLISGEKRWTAITRMTPEEYDAAFPKGILCKVIPHVSNLSEMDEKIMLLSANVLVFSSGAPDVRQLRDLIALYLQKGYKRKELVDYLKGFFDKNIKTIYKMVDEAKAIPELTELYNEKRISRAALQRLGGLTEEEQREAYQMIINGDEDKVDEKMVVELKRAIKSSRKAVNQAPSENTLAFLKMKRALDSISAGIEKGKKASIKEMSALEKELVIANINIIRTELKQLEEGLEKEGK